MAFKKWTFFLSDPGIAPSKTPDIREGVLVIGTTVQIILVALRLDGWLGIDWSWYAVFIPVWVTSALSLYLDCIILTRLLTTRRQANIKPIILERIPTTILVFFFFFLLVRRIETQRVLPDGPFDSFGVVFVPLFLWGSLAILYSLARLTDSR